MATGKTIRIPERLRALLCVMIAASLGVQFVAGGSSADERRDSVQLLCALTSSPAIQANRGCQRFEDSKQRTAADSLFILINVVSLTPTGARLVTAIDNLMPWSSSAANRQSGRSPPHQIS